MKIDNAISIELHDGQRLSLSLKEAKELYRKLGKMLLTDSSEGKREKMKGRRIAGKKMKGRRIVTERSRGISSAKSSLPTSRKVISLSDAKRQEILVHFNKEISATPRTL